MKKDVYVFPALLTIENDGVSVEFPDLCGCLTFGDNYEDAIKNSKEALGLHLYGLEEDEEIIPSPSELTKLTIGENQIPILIDIYMPLYRKAIENQSVKKTLTIPQWLNKEAIKHNINFSQILQDGIKEHLGINHKL